MHFSRTALAGLLSMGLVLSPSHTHPAHAQSSVESAHSIDSLSSEVTNIDQHSSVLDPIALGPLAPVLFAENVFAAWGPLLQLLKIPIVEPEATHPPATAAPAQMRELRHIQDNVWQIEVYSPSMDRVITNDIILPPGGLENTQPRPTYYLLGGAGGGEDALWWDGGGASEFFRDKHVNVVSPRGAYGSMMSDWAQPHDTHGKYKWATYLTKELPQLIDSEFHGNGTDGIAGVSNSGGPALELATYDPRFKVAGSISGCPSTTGVVAQGFAWVSAAFYGTDPTRSFGPPWDPAWARHSPVLNLDQQKGRKTFVIVSRGGPADFDVDIEDSPLPALGLNERLDYWCSSYYAKQATAAGVDLDYYVLPEGRHTWGLFRRELAISWATVGPALGVE